MKGELMIYRLLCMLLLLSGCSVLPDLDDVLPDKRTEYKRSESLPDLEVPPDLTAGAINESMAIPNEQQQATLSQYRREQQGVPAAAAPVASVDQQWVSVRASRFDVWPRLRAFFEDKGFALELDDAELGVLETAWSAAVAEAAGNARYKYKVFSEPGADPAVTLLYVSAARQLQAGSDWIDGQPSDQLDKKLAGELNLHLNGAQAIAAQPAGAAAAAAGPRAEILNDEQGRVYLAIPEEFTGAWRHTEIALQQAGFTIDSKDAAKGMYRISYTQAAEGAEQKGFFSKLAFWRDDAPESRSYGISLTGIGERTELIVMNDAGDWETNEDAGRILGVIQNQYNTR